MCFTVPCHCGAIGMNDVIISSVVVGKFEELVAISSHDGSVVCEIAQPGGSFDENGNRFEETDSDPKWPQGIYVL